MLDPHIMVEKSPKDHSCNLEQNKSNEGPHIVLGSPYTARGNGPLDLFKPQSL